jgi:hypothetical protein
MTSCKSIMAILVSHRSKNALRVQELLTEYGCSIKTRLGIHDGVGDRCSDDGLILLELAGESPVHKELCEKLKALEGIAVELINLCI